MASIGVKLFQKIIVGTFDNSAQVNKERKTGSQKHPLARHVTEVMDHRIKNMPKDFDGSFILEESYYDYPDKEQIVKPLLFKVTPCGPYDIFLESIIVPEHLDKAKVINANPDLYFNFNEIQLNEKFGKAMYHNMGDHFLVNHTCNFGGGITFNLVETLKLGELLVMETYTKDGKNITPYDSAIHYKIKK